jgi:tol-pal system-associated acyl-CoA thioesterase
MKLITDFRVYYGDTDAGGVMYHPNYADIFARARNEWAREMGMDIAQQTALSICFVVKSMSLNYHLPARLDDKVSVETELEDASRVLLTFNQRLYRTADQVLLCDGIITVVTVSLNTFKPKRLTLEQYKEFIGE